MAGVAVGASLGPGRVVVRDVDGAVHLTDAERRSVGCRDCWQMDGVWQHKRGCHAAETERIVADRIAALTQDRGEARAALARVEEEWDAVNERSAFLRQQLEDYAQKFPQARMTLARVKALADEWAGRGFHTVPMRSLRAALAAPAPTADQAQGGDLP